MENRMSWIFDQVKQVIITKDCDDDFFVNYVKEWHGERYDEYKEHLVLYVDEGEKKIPIHASSSTDSIAPQKITFAKYLLDMKELTYENVLAALGTYHHFIDGANFRGPFYSPPTARPMGEPYEVIENILESTNGYLVFNEQMEKIFMILRNCRKDEAVRFRKDINMKRPAAKELARSILLRPRFSLLDLMRWRCWDTDNLFLYEPPYRNAMILYGHLRKRYVTVTYNNILSEANKSKSE